MKECRKSREVGEKQRESQKYSVTSKKKKKIVKEREKLKAMNLVQKKKKRKKKMANLGFESRKSDVRATGLNLCPLLAHRLGHAQTLLPM